MSLVDVSMDEVVARKQDIIAMFCTSRPPKRFFQPDLDGRNDELLLAWIRLRHRRFTSFHRPPTALSILEAAEAIANSRLDNGTETLIRTRYWAVGDKVKIYRGTDVEVGQIDEVFQTTVRVGTESYNSRSGRLRRTRTARTPTETTRIVRL